MSKSKANIRKPEQTSSRNYMDTKDSSNNNTKRPTNRSSNSTTMLIYLMSSLT